MWIMPRWGSGRLGRPDELGRSLLHRGEFERAAECFERAMRGQRDPRHPDHRRALLLAVEARGLLGLKRFHARRTAEAETEFGRALLLSPAHPRLRYYRARVLQRTGRVSEAAGELGLAIELEPDASEPYLALAVCHSRRGIEAARLLDRVLALEAARGRGSRAAGRSRAPARSAETRPLRLDIEQRTNAVRERPSYPDLRHRLALPLIEAGRLEEAEVELERALRVNPGYLDALVLCTRVQLALGHARRAARRLESALEVFPGYPDLCFWLGLACFRVGRPRPAATALEQAVGLNRHFARAQRLLGLVYHALGRRVEALRCLERGLNRDRELEIETLGGGGALRENPSGPSGQLERAVALRPDYPDLHLALARERRARGSLEAARESCRSALSLKRDYGGAAFELARLELGLGRLEAAERLLEDLARTHPHWADVRALLGRVRRMCGDRRGAAGALRESWGLNPA